MIKPIIGFFLVISGIVLGVYVGGWLMFVGGIMDLITAVNILIKTSAIPEVTLVGKGIFKLMFSGLVGWVSFFILGIPGVVLIADK